jgi:hypothetical protein
MTNKTFAVAGVSKTKGQYKVRFANDIARVKILAKTDQDIELMTLPNEMTKGEIVQFLLTQESYTSNPDWAEAIRNADAKYNGSVKVTKQEVSLDSIKARVLEGSVAVEAEMA